MFAVVRTGGKQYRVTAGDKIVVEKLAGEAGDKIDITDILLAGEGSELKSVAGLIVGAEIVAQAKADKVTVFKKRRRHNYRRKAGHRQKPHDPEDRVDRRREGQGREAEGGSRSGRAEGRCCTCEGGEGSGQGGSSGQEGPKPKAKADKAPSTKDAAPAKAAAKKAPKAK